MVFIVKSIVGLGGKISGVILRIYNKITSRIFYFLKDFGLVWLVEDQYSPNPTIFLTQREFLFFLVWFGRL